jgi:hypothetical protein
MVKSKQIRPKMARVTIWNIKPASIRLLPSDRVELVVEDDATPPPAPWRDREMMSQPMKKRVYMVGLMRESSSP